MTNWSPSITQAIRIGRGPTLGRGPTVNGQRGAPKRASYPDDSVGMNKAAPVPPIVKKNKVDANDPSPLITQLLRLLGYTQITSSERIAMKRLLDDPSHPKHLSVMHQLIADPRSMELVRKYYTIVGHIPKAVRGLF